MHNVAFSVLLFTLCASAFGADADAPKVKPYTLDTCAISGEKIGDMGDAVTKVYKGQEVKFCCNGCIKKFEKDIDGNLKVLNAEMEKAAADKTKAPAAKPAAHEHAK